MVIFHLEENDRPFDLPYKQINKNCSALKSRTFQSFTNTLESPMMRWKDTFHPRNGSPDAIPQDVSWEMVIWAAVVTLMYAAITLESVSSVCA
jgi:hypothetical protein